MERNFWVVCGDARSRYAGEYLRSRGEKVLAYGVKGLEQQPLPAVFRQLILPFPSFEGGKLRGPEPLPVEELLCRLNADSCVFGGLLGAHRESMEQRGAHVFDLYGSEPLSTRNAVLTAEAALCLAVENSPQALQNAHCLVIGYGRIGKILAHRLQALSARVTVAARKAADRALAEALGHSSQQCGLYPEGLAQYSYIFNTVPAEVLSRAQLSQIGADCLLVELASPPGGFSQSLCRELGLRCLPASGLPGRFSPAAAGRLYAQSILNLSQGEEPA